MAQRERTRHVPSPLNFSPRSPPPLLYDLPTTTLTSSATTTPPVTSPRSPRSPPRTPRGRAQALLSPKTANFNSLHGQRNSPAGLHHPQPSHAHGAFGAHTPNRSIASTPTQLDAFGALCRAWYFQQDQQAGTQIEEVLRTIPASQRASYTRLQAQIRSSYHTAVALRRESEFHAHLTSTIPGHSLTPMNRQNPTSPSAKAERLDRVRKLTNVWATSGNVGTRPFFEGLFAILRLQGLPTNLGGAGDHRMSWEVDDAVFKESAGKEFMLEAIDVLKGVLGFEEALVASGSHAEETLSAIMIMDSPTQPQAAIAPSPRPPPLPQRPDVRYQLESRTGRPPLPSIASASVINRRRDSSAHPNDDIQVLADDEDDAFADPIPSPGRRASSPTNKLHRPTFSPGNTDPATGTNRRSVNDALNRNRSPSDPFADTHGHLNYGHGHRNSRTLGSLGVLPGAGPIPSLVPLLANGGGGGGSSVDTATTSLNTGSQLQKTVPLPSEDFELDIAGPLRTAVGVSANATPAVGTPDSDEEEGAELLSEPEPPSKRSSSFGLGLVGKNRRGSETTGLGLVVPGMDQPPSKPSFSSTVTPPPKTQTPSNSDIVSLSKLQQSGQFTPHGLFTGGSYPSYGDEPHLRIWTVPSYLGNPEIAQLLSAFPTNISSESVPRFRGSAGMNAPKSRQSGSIRSRRGQVDLDLEAQDDEEQPVDYREYVRHGTGRVFISHLERGEGWRGTMWERLRSWWRRVFC